MSQFAIKIISLLSLCLSVVVFCPPAFANNNELIESKEDYCGSIQLLYGQNLSQTFLIQKFKALYVTKDNQIDFGNYIDMGLELHDFLNEKNSENEGEKHQMGIFEPHQKFKAKKVFMEEAQIQQSFIQRFLYQWETDRETVRKYVLSKNDALVCSYDKKRSWWYHPDQKNENDELFEKVMLLSLIHISEPTRPY